MIRRTFHFSFKLFFEVLAVIITGVLILLGAFIYQISKKPININFLNPYIQDSLHTISKDLNINTKETLLSFEDGEFKVDFKDIMLLSKGTNLNIASLELSFSFQSILQKVPSSILVDRTKLFLKLDEQGKLDFQLMGSVDKTAVVIPVSQKISQILNNEKIQELKQIVLTNSSISIENKSMDKILDFKDVNLSFLRNEEGNIEGHSKLIFENKDLELYSLYNIETLDSDITFYFKSIDISSFSDKFSQLASLKTDIDGNVRAHFDKDFKVDFVELNGEVKNGSYLILKEYFDEDLPIEGEFNFIYDDNIIKTKKCLIDLNGIKLDNNIIVKLLENKIDFSYELNTFSFLMLEIEKKWPKGIAQGAKDWVVTNLRDGNIDKVNLNIIGSLENKTDLLLNDLNGFINFSNMNVHYLEGLPNVTNVSGKANFDREKFDIDIVTGNIRDVKVNNGSKVLIPFEDSIVDINIDLSGNAKTVAYIINNEPLGYMDKAGIHPDNIDGGVEGNLKLEIPMDERDLKVNVEAKLKDVSVNKLIFDQDLKNANGVLKVNNDKLNLNAYGIFDKARVKINWDEFFKDDAQYERVAELDGLINIILLKDMGIIDLTSMVDGDILATGLYKAKKGKATIFVKSNLLGTELDLSPIPYKNKKDETAPLELLIRLDNNKFKSLDNIKLKDKNIEITGDYKNHKWSLSKLYMPNNNIDISGYYKDEGDKIPNIDISGKMGKEVSLKIFPIDGKNTINFQVEDLGETLRSLKIWEKLYGGRLGLQGVSSDNLSILKGRLLIENFNVVKMTPLAKILAAMSLEDLESAIEGSGITFDKLSSDFTWDYSKKQFNFKDGKTKGSALGITFDNIWDMKNNTIAMKGTIAPLQGVNKLIKDIPIVGTILTGTKQEGLFGANYVVKGPLSDLKVDVDTMSTFTPGVLREMFFSGESLEKTIDKENKKKEEKEKLENLPNDLNSLRGVR